MEPIRIQTTIFSTKENGTKVGKMVRAYFWWKMAQLIKA